MCDRCQNSATIPTGSLLVFFWQVGSTTKASCGQVTALKELNPRVATIPLKTLRAGVLREEESRLALAEWRGLMRMVTMAWYRRWNWHFTGAHRRIYRGNTGAS
jgi:hypothetical protein